MVYPSLHLARDVDEASHTSEQENGAPPATEGNIYRRDKVALYELQKRLPDLSTCRACETCTRRWASLSKKIKSTSIMNFRSLKWFSLKTFRLAYVVLLEDLRRKLLTGFNSTSLGNLHERRMLLLLSILKDYGRVESNFLNFGNVL